MQLEQRIAGAYFLAGLHENHDADRRIHGILDAIAAGSEQDRGLADAFGVEAREIARPRCFHHASIGRVREATVIVHYVRVAALGFDDPPEPVEAFPGRDRRARAALTVGPIARDA